jgi:hypothetical protein
MGFLAEILRRIEEITGGLIDDIVRADRSLGRLQIGDSDITDSDLFIRKFVAGLVYCGGKKRQVFAITFEEDDTDREEELLDAIEQDLSRECSPIRENRGYSEEPGQSPGSGSAIWPEIEVGFE